MARQQKAGKAASQAGTPPLNADSPWKDILEKLFSYFLLFFFPGIHVRIDWSRKPEFLDTELRTATRRSQTGKRFVDKLVKVWLLSGAELWLLIHVEIQGQRESGFEHRMYQYHCRLIDHFNKPVMTLVILTDDDASWRPEKFSYEYPEGKYELVFPTRKLIDYESRWSELEQDPNPFSVVVMAHLRALSTEGNAVDRYAWKVRLARGLYKRGYDKDKIIELFRFIDWIMELPEELERHFDAEVERLEGEIGVTFVMGIERRATEKGLEKGRQEGRQEGQALALLVMLEERFGSVSDEDRMRVQTADSNTLRQWFRNVLTADRVESVLE